eukprot:560525-Rhodomonas_salina.1
MASRAVLTTTCTPRRSSRRTRPSARLTATLTSVSSRKPVAKRKSWTNTRKTYSPASMRTPFWQTLWQTPTSIPAAMSNLDSTSWRC